MQDAIELIQHYGLIVVFVSVLMDEGGLPVPSYPALIVAAALTMGALDQLAAIIVVGTLASLLADLGWYWTGWHYGRKVLAVLCRISLAPDSCVKDSEFMFAKMGSSSLTISKFIPGLSNIAASLAGSLRQPVPAFLVYDTIGSFLYVGVPVLLGIVFHDAIEDVLGVLVELGKWGLVLLGAALGAYWAGKWWQRQRFIRQLRMDRISVEELRDMIDRGVNPIILDVRSHALREREGAIPGSIPANASELEDVLKDHSIDIEIVVYCSCPNEATAATAANHLRKAGFKKIRPLLGGIEAWTNAGYSVARIVVAAD